MKFADYFRGVCLKRLAAVEIEPTRSNQHEFNGVKALKELFGLNRVKLKVRYLSFNELGDVLEHNESSITWYDARENNPNRSEFRLYFEGSFVYDNANPGDLLVIAKLNSEEALVILAKEGTSAENQLLWLFNYQDLGDAFSFKGFNDNGEEINFMSRLILEKIGVQVPYEDDSLLDDLLNEFPKGLPATKDFSAYARRHSGIIWAGERPDKALVGWLDHEELLFKTYEKYLLKDRLKDGFGQDGSDVEAFIKFSLSVQNRRKSRAGYAFEHHLEELFKLHGIAFSRGARTERNNKPDFLFPSIASYKDADFDSEYLTMLGVKTTAKDRWRQILSEAERIGRKHLITLEPAISENQTEEMKSNNVALVIPEEIQTSYTIGQKSEILSVSEFIKVVSDKQNQAGVRRV